MKLLAYIYSTHFVQKDCCQLLDMALHHLYQQNLEHFLQPSIVDLVQQGHNHLMFVVLETLSTKKNDPV